MAELESVTNGSLVLSVTEAAEPDSFGYPTIEMSILAIVIAAVSFLTIAGNILVIVAFATDEKLRTFGNYFILNLSLTDLFVGILIPIYAPYALLGRWPFSRRFCVAFNVVDYIVPLASSWNIAVISLDRYISVSRPIAYRLKQSVPKALALMSVPWIAGFLIFAPAIVLWEHITGRVSVPQGECWVEYYDHIPYLLFGSTMEFIVPFVTVAVANLLIYLNLRKRSRGNMKKTQVAPLGNGGGGGVGTGGAVAMGTVAAAGTGAGGGGGGTSTMNADKATKDLARDKKTARSLAILVGVYGLTWAPYEVCALMNPLCSFCVPDKVFEVTFWWLWVNSTINPMLYPFLQVKFRVAFTRLLCRCRKAVVVPVSTVNTATMRSGT